VRGSVLAALAAALLAGCGDPVAGMLTRMTLVNELPVAVDSVGTHTCGTTEWIVVLREPIAAAATRTVEHIAGCTDLVAWGVPQDSTMSQALLVLTGIQLEPDRTRTVVLTRPEEPCTTERLLAGLC
jgi:hypothetical protein